MLEKKIHALIFGSPGRPSVISVSGEYSVTFDHENLLMVIVPASQSERTVNHRLASFNALYGENGSGKTELLMQVAMSFIDRSKGPKVGMLYSDNGQLFLYKGSSLGRFAISRSNIPVRFAKAPLFGNVVFYSTSPFESRRRASLKGKNVKDVSPPFGRELYFDGLSFLDSYKHVQGRAPFLNKLRINVRGKLPSVDLVVDRIMSLFDDEKFPGHRSRTIRLQIRTWLSELNEDLLELTTLSLFLITSVQRSDELGPHFADRVIGLINRMAENSEYVGTAPQFAETCIRFVEDFPELINYNATQLWGFLRGRDGILHQASRIEFHSSPAELDALIPSDWRKPNGIARFASNLGLLNFRLKHLSSGECAFLMLYASLASALASIAEQPNDSAVVVLIDEGEMFLHPSWQRQYLTNLFDFICTFPEIASKTHLLVSTHSLIVAGDAPPNTLFDVQTGQTRNGFGLGPGEILSEVYHVKRFAGGQASELIDKVVEFLRDKRAENFGEITAIADLLADEELKSYVKREIERRLGEIDDKDFDII